MNTPLYNELSPEELNEWCKGHEEIVEKRIAEIKARLITPEKPKLTLVKG